MMYQIKVKSSVKTNNPNNRFNSIFTTGVIAHSGTKKLKPEDAGKIAVSYVQKTIQEQNPSLTIETKVMSCRKIKDDFCIAID